MAEEESTEAIRPEFPSSRVKKIMKLDKDINKVNAEALFLVSCSAELFLRFLAERSAEVAIEKKRKTVKLEHMRIAVKRHRPTSDFLLDSLPVPSQALDPPAVERKRPRDAADKPAPAGTRRIDQFFQKPATDAPEQIVHEKGIDCIISSNDFPKLQDHNIFYTACEEKKFKEIRAEVGEHIFCKFDIGSNFCYHIMEKGSNQAYLHKVYQKCSEQWLPVHAWLESLDKKEVVRSKDISKWLSENPKVKQQLYARYSHYHLMHYVQKCHSRILKRREKAKHSHVAALQKGTNDVAETLPVQLPSSCSSKMLEGNDLYIKRRKEALCKYKILTELEDRLSVVLSNFKKENGKKSNSSTLAIGKKTDDGCHQNGVLDEGGKTSQICSDASVSP